MYIYGGSAGTVIGDNSGAANRIILRDSNTIEFHINGSENMRINDSGTLQIGKTSSSASDAGHQFFQSGPYYLYSPATQAIRFYNTDIGSQAGHITISGSTISMANGTSDLSTKENINDWNENVLESFKNIKPVTFNYKNDETKEVKKGYIAQNEVDKFPEAYAKNSEDNLHWFHPSEMTVYLMKAIQELSAKVEELESKINE